MDSPDTPRPTPVSALVTSAAESGALMEAELREIFPKLPSFEWIVRGSETEGSIARIEPGMDFNTLAGMVEHHAPVFVRHLAPVQRVIPLMATEEDLTALRDAALEIGEQLDSAAVFSVQTRIVGEGQLPYRKVTVNETLSALLEAQTGAVMECRTPEQVVSVLCTPTRGYMGVSRTERNRSAWPGGKHRFRHEEGQVSRSEFKLLEAMNVFGMALPERGIALDMGAAPGGWTRVLRAHGLQVTAVDPADLDPRLREDRGIRHVRERLQDYLPHSRQRFHVIVNDMKMDARASVELMLRASRLLESGGLAVMTLKLPRAERPPHQLLALVRADLQRLTDAYTILEARHLYHNRHEVTVALTSCN
ncbi:MAG: methyltransferase domain-containing protein [Armatimonadetes bacterium]|nr:methyltransferase domain-containing protein [Armatimonadota bacterium]